MGRIIIMPQGKGTYGRKVGRPPKKSNGLTAKQMKLPAGLRKAILASKKRKGK
tara:strand:- start:2420 stop:2578 length:159 start_codon:yes stop_codon:yes gene_type:complete